MKLSDEVLDVVVVGGGASGMFAAIHAGSRRKKVLILDKNRELGEKLAITGGGRCNITNAEHDRHAFLKNYGKDAKFLYSPYSQFSVEDTFEFFESRGLPLVVQGRKRAFPETEKATDVVALLNKELVKNKVFVKTSCSVKRFITDAGKITGVETNQGTFRARSFILATGGASHPETGSTGDGFTFLKSLGHTIKDPTPTIVPLSVSDAWIKALAGISFPHVKMTFSADGKKQFSKTGKFLCTHFGLSGPMILNSAIQVASLLEGGGTVSVSIDAYPDTDLGTLEKKVIGVFDEHKNKSLRTILKDICPVGTAKGIQMLLGGMNLDTKVNSISRDDRKKIVRLLKALPATITGLMGYDRAVVADGGVVLTEIDTRSMRSLKYDNLYVTGDLLHINRPSGGYSLQLCWTTGYVAGMGV